MNVSYALIDGNGRIEERFETFREAVLARNDDELWLLLDDAPAMALPDSFNRIVFQGGEEIVSSVLAWHETQGQRLPVPTLILDFDANAARWTNGHSTRRLYG